MSPVLPFDIAALIIDIAGENNDTDFLKKLALVSHSFHQICSKYLFATVELHDADPTNDVASSKEGFVKLLKSRPDVVKHIRKLIYRLGFNDRFRSPQSLPTNSCLVNSSILSNFLRTITHLNYLNIRGPLNWNTLNPSLIPALIHLMRLPTINHIDLSLIRNFPLSIFTPSVNLLRLDIFFLICVERLEDPGFVVHFPKIREFHTSESSLLTRKLLHSKMQDGQPAFNFMGLRRLSMSFTDDRNLRYTLQNAKLLENLRLSVGCSQSLVGLLSPSARTLKVLGLKVFLKNKFSLPPLGGLCEELEAIAGHNMLEVLSFDVFVGVRDTEDFVGPIIQNIEKVLVKPGWSALRQVSLKITCLSIMESSVDCAKFSEALQYLPDKYLSHLSKLESVAFDYSISTHM